MKFSCRKYSRRLALKVLLNLNPNKSKQIIPYKREVKWDKMIVF